MVCFIFYKKYSLKSALSDSTLIYVMNILNLDLHWDTGK